MEIRSVDMVKLPRKSPSQLTAERQAERIMRYWRDLGHPHVMAWPELSTITDRDGPLWAVVSNLVNGLPPERAA